MLLIITKVTKNYCLINIPYNTYFNLFSRARLQPIAPCLQIGIKENTWSVLAIRNGKAIKNRIFFMV